ncbi:hypothetical protein AYI70_g2544 [Smittium culicis]|uniref:Endonuclease/exonuclease/phosphatase domain-containing protein n=1 Tax=Smittium culicis TaxID=133412 RepID=A0A1R1Y8E4_9FUNG|nr:hypothetical protein AYI70_g2544 [Smittium culicis]
MPFLPDRYSDNELYWQPGQIVYYDCRHPSHSKNTSLRDFSSEKPLTAISWNIERGYKLDGIIEQLAKLDADIICLQELDLFNERSGGTNQFNILCEKLGLLGCYVTEFIELKSDMRSKHQQGGGVHGNAILSKFNMVATSRQHDCQPVDWNNDGPRYNEPRVGKYVHIFYYVYQAIYTSPVSYNKTPAFSRVPYMFYYIAQNFNC